MKHTVSKIILFTLAACPTGRNMGTILEEVGQINPSIEFNTIYVEIDVETTNHYKIKTNPTLLLLDRNDSELYRLEGFHETSEINQVIDEINANDQISIKTYEKNKETIEKYSIFLLRNGEPAAVNVQHQNKTSIRAPRITVINLLLSASIDGYENPFPTDTKLQHLEFVEDSLAKITIKTENHLNSADKLNMETLLLQTLKPFGILKVYLSFI